MLQRLGKILIALSTTFLLLHTLTPHSHVLSQEVRQATPISPVEHADIWCALACTISQDIGVDHLEHFQIEEDDVPSPTIKFEQYFSLLNNKTFGQHIDYTRSIFTNLSFSIPKSAFFNIPSFRGPPAL